MQHMEDIDVDNTNPNTATGIGDPYPPVRDIIAITISETGSLIYYDQWEHAAGGGRGYDTDIANPTDPYSSGNPGGTQIWGDGVLANGCPPAKNNGANPCTDPKDDLLYAGDVVTLDNLTPLTPGAGDFHGSWIGTRSAAQVRFDGKDKIGATAPIAATRAGWSVGNHVASTGTINATFSLFGDAVAMDATDQWGTSFVTPVGKNSTMPNPYPFGYSHVEVMAREANTFVFVDVDKDGVQDAGETATIGEGGMFDPSPNPNPCNSSASLQCGLDFGVPITSNKPVQVTLVTGAPQSTWASRWYNLTPRPRWTNEYVTSVGTNPQTGAGCTSVWVYNPNASAVNVTQTTSAGSNSLSVAANSSTRLLLNTTYNIPAGRGAKYSAPPGSNFYAVSVTDCEAGTGQLYDWGSPLLSTADLSDQALAGWAPGCSNESNAGICVNTGAFTGNTNSRNALWLSPLSNTTIYVDENGSGITCSNGTYQSGAEKTVPASALTSQSIFAETGLTVSRASVFDNFDNTPSYANNSPNPDSEVTWDTNWTNAWTETGDSATTPVHSSGAIYINSGQLRLGPGTAPTPPSVLSIQRTVPTNGKTYARLSFDLSAAGSPADKSVVVEISKDNGANWILEEAFTNPSSVVYTQVYPINLLTTTPNLIVRFKIASTLAPGQYWAIDNVNVDFANTDWDLTGAFLRTCDGTKFMAVYGEDPLKSGSGDNEAPDLGTLIPAFRPLARTGSIGNYVWLDEDGDGDQDAGESGIPNVKVELYDAANVLKATTYTDANGGYLFTNLPPGTYSVKTYPSGGLNATYDEDGTGTLNTSSVVLAAGAEYLTADFGYNWATPNETNNNTGFGAIGDRVWIDTNGNGVQDTNESGLAGVSVQLWYDQNGDGVIDTQTMVTTATTDANGNYIFDGLSKGIYEVRVTAGTTGYTQTGDPDQFGIACTGCDAKTTAPIVLGPGDVFLNADFGYQPATSGVIGDFVWMDADRDKTQDSGEPGINNVTVALIKDANGDGRWDAGEPIIATTITGDNPATGTVETGWYTFSGLPVADGLGTDDYLVWVNDTSHVLGELEATYDKDGANPLAGTPPGVVGGLGITTVSNLTTTAVTDVDFGYGPPTIFDLQTGAIGDTVFLDRDGNGLFDTGEGLEGVGSSCTTTSAGCSGARRRTRTASTCLAAWPRGRTPSGC